MIELPECTPSFQILSSRTQLQILEEPSTVQWARSRDPADEQAVQNDIERGEIR